MTVISDTELHQAFQREYPKDLHRTTEGKLLHDFSPDGDRVEAEKLVGKNWEDIGPDLLRDFFDLPCWLNPLAFHYFFPAFIKQSQIDVDKTSLLVDSVINILADAGVGRWPESLKDIEAQLLKEYPEIAETLDSIDEKELSEWNQERWELFTKQQWDLVRKWLNWINEDKRWEVQPDLLQKAKKNAAHWQAAEALHLNGESQSGKVMNNTFCSFCIGFPTSVFYGVDHRLCLCGKKRTAPIASSM